MKVSFSFSFREKSGHGNYDEKTFLRAVSFYFSNMEILYKKLLNLEDGGQRCEKHFCGNFSCCCPYFVATPYLFCNQQ